MARPHDPTAQPWGGNRLVVLTGASHTGKSSVALELSRLAPPPVALLGVDATLDHTLVRPEGDRWAQIPMAYRLNRAQLDILLTAGWTVIFESTFTYVPTDGAPEFHESELQRVVAVGHAAGAAPIVVQLVVPEAVALSRSAATDRVDGEVVRQTVRLHGGAVLSPALDTLRIDGTGSSPEQIARRILTNARPPGESQLTHPS